MTPYQKARKLIMDAIYPDGVPLVKGCEFEWCNEDMEQVLYEIAWIAKTEDILTGNQGFSMYAFTKGKGKNNDPYPKWHSFDNPEDYEEDDTTFFDYATILGKEPSLPEVLRAIESREADGKRFELEIINSTTIKFYMSYWHGEGDVDICEYNLNTPLLKDQSEEVHEFIISVLSK